MCNSNYVNVKDNKAVYLVTIFEDIFIFIWLGIDIIYIFLGKIYHWIGDCNCKYANVVETLHCNVSTPIQL